MTDIGAFRDAYLDDAPWPSATSRYVHELSKEIHRLEARNGLESVCAHCGETITRTLRNRAPWLAETKARGTCYKRSDGKYYHEPKEA